MKQKKRPKGRGYPFGTRGRRADDFVPDRNLASDAAEFVAKLIPDAYRSDPAALRAEISAMSIKQRRASRTQHYRQVAIAYALAVAFGDRIEILREDARATGNKARQPDALRQYLEMLIDYSDTARDKHSVQKLYGRDARAIRYLQSQKVAPSDVESRSASKGEGLDSWARAYAGQKKSVEALKAKPELNRTKASPVSKKKTPTNSSISVSIDGARSTEFDIPVTILPLLMKFLKGISTRASASVPAR